MSLLFGRARGYRDYVLFFYFIIFFSISVNNDERATGRPSTAVEPHTRPG